MHAWKFHAREPGGLGDACREQRGRPAGEGECRTTCVHVFEESDSGTVPMNHPNNSGRPPAEGEEGRPLIKENTHQSSTLSTQSEVRVSQGFQHQADADRFLAEFRERLRKFGLELHPDKTRRIEFGRFAELNRKQRGEGKPEAFDFLGFTHISGKDRKGGYAVKRKTSSKRMRAKLLEMKQQLRRRMHESVELTGKWLRSIVQGYFNYHAVPGNIDSLC